MQDLLDTELGDTDGQRAPLRARLGGAPAVLVFVRHFG
jgi:hypothetical protein